MQITVAPPDFDDWPALLALLQQAFAYMVPRIDPPSSLDQMGVAELRRKATDDCLIIASDGQLLLACVFAAVHDDCVYVGKLAVADQARGRGLARQLLAAAEQVAREHQRAFLELQTRIELVENQQTFAALGFVEVARTAHPGYTRPTSITLRRPVPRRQRSRADP
jgi:GNAT superfamily N-acetyltransferase